MLVASSVLANRCWGHNHLNKRKCVLALLLGLVVAYVLWNFLVQTVHWVLCHWFSLVDQLDFRITYRFEFVRRFYNRLVLRLTLTLARLLLILAFDWWLVCCWVALVNWDLSCWWFRQLLWSNVIFGLNRCQLFGRVCLAAWQFLNLFRWLMAFSMGFFRDHVVLRSLNFTYFFFRL